MTRGRMPGGAGAMNPFDEMMGQISQISTNIVKTRKELLKEEESKEGEITQKGAATKTAEGTQKAEPGKTTKTDKRKKLREEKRGKEKRERLRE